MKSGLMVIQKLLSTEVGTHYPEQAMILTEKGEIFVTKSQSTEQGFELVRFQTYDLDQLATIINNLLRGKSLAATVNVTIQSQSIYVSAIARVFKAVGYSPGTVLNQIEGGREGQQITLIGDGTSLTVTSGGNLVLDGTMTITNQYSILMLQKVGGSWVEVSRNQNG